MDSRRLEGFILSGKHVKFCGMIRKQLSLACKLAEIASHKEDFREVYQEELPNVKSMRDIGKTCGEKWKTMNFEEKVKYYDIATEKRQEFEDAMAAYLKKESGELLKQLDEDYESDGIYD